MATMVEVLRDYGVEIRANGQKRWPDEVKERWFGLFEQVSGVF